MPKIMTIVGTRPELIKMSRVIAELDAHTSHILVHSGQNYDYELNQIFFDDLDIRKPDYFLEAAREGAAQTIAEIIARSDELFAKEKPDAVLLYGDTNSCLSVISAKRRKVPVFHMEAGNRCFDQRVPEEINRKIVDHLSDINMVLTEHARRYLLAEGIRAETIIKTGSHMREVLSYYRPKIDQSDVLSRFGLKSRSYFVVSAHREENVDSPEALRELLASLNALAQSYRMPIIFSTHPRTRQRLEKITDVQLSDLITFSKPLGLCDYIKLQMQAACVLSDSGTITEEAALLRFPAVTIRNTHERPEGMDAGTLVMCGLSTGRVLDAVKLVMSQSPGPAADIADYGNEQVAKQVVRIVTSYIDYVRRTVWAQ